MWIRGCDMYYQPKSKKTKRTNAGGGERRGKSWHSGMERVKIQILRGKERGSSKSSGLQGWGHFREMKPGRSKSTTQMEGKERDDVRGVRGKQKRQKEETKNCRKLVRKSGERFWTVAGKKERSFYARGGYSSWDYLGGRIFDNRKGKDEGFSVGMWSKARPVLTCIHKGGRKTRWVNIIKETGDTCRKSSCEKGAIWNKHVKNSYEREKATANDIGASPCGRMGGKSMCLAKNVRTGGG